MTPRPCGSYRTFANEVRPGRTALPRVDARWRDRRGSRHIVRRNHHPDAFCWRDPGQKRHPDASNRPPEVPRGHPDASNRSRKRFRGHPDAFNRPPEVPGEHPDASNRARERFRGHTDGSNRSRERLRGHPDASECPRDELGARPEASFAARSGSRRPSSFNRRTLRPLPQQRRRLRAAFRPVAPKRMSLCENGGWEKDRGSPPEWDDVQATSLGEQRCDLAFFH